MSVKFRYARKIINEVWGKKVKLVRCGPRQQRKSFYQNLKVKENNESPQETWNEFITKVNQLQLKDGWSIICENDKLSFIRLESWSFRNQRGSTEVRIEKMSLSRNLVYSITAHGCEYPLSKLMDIPSLEKHPLERESTSFWILSSARHCALQQTLTLLKSPFLRCCPISVGNIGTMIMSSSRYFRNKSSIIQCRDGICCVNYRNIKLLTDRSKRRKLSSDCIHPFTNKRFLTKDELAKQLGEETRARKNAEKRETYWKKFFAHCLEMENSQTNPQQIRNIYVPLLHLLSIS